MLTIRLNRDMEEKLTKLTIKTGHTKTYYVRTAIAEFIGNIEDRELALQRLENPQATFTQDQLEAKIDLEN